VGTEDVYTGISKLHRERGDLAAATQDLITSKKLGEQVEIPDWQYRWCIAQAQLNETMGDLDGALGLLDKAELLYVRTPVPEVHPISAMKTRVWVAQGRIAEAIRWQNEQGITASDDLSFIREFEHITLARVLIAQYKNDSVDDSIQKATGLLQRLLKAAEEGGRTGSVIEILVLQALTFEAVGNIPSALTSLGRALTLAEPEGYFRLFVDEGPPMARLLQEGFPQGIIRDYTRRLMAAFPSDKLVQADSLKTKTSEFEWIEPLSERELEVLQLIAEGLTNRAIADRLYLSLNTVKVHIPNIYGKLNVHSRTQAVSKARDLEILPS
jgi:LuxR family maltose regulon positive regulatory protein